MVGFYDKSLIRCNGVWVLIKDDDKKKMVRFCIEI